MFDWDSFEKLSEEEKMEKFRQHLNDLKKKKAESYGPLGAYLFLQLQPEWECTRSCQRSATPIWYGSLSRRARGCCSAYPERVSERT